MYNKIIIWGRDNFNTLGLLRQLSGEGGEIFFLMWGKPVGCASASKYFGEHVVVESMEEGYQYLMTHFTNEPPKPVVFTPSDELIEFIDQHKIELQQNFILPGTKEQGLLTKIDDKNTMTEMASRLGFLVPTSIIFRWDSDISEVQYPCILKPAHTTVGRHNEFKYKICENEKELKNTLRIVRHDSEFVLQQYIPKESVALVYGARMSDGQVKIAGVFVKDRFISCGDGSHGYISSSFPKGIEIDKIETFLKEIDYCGLFSFEYGLYDDKAYFFEVNLRNDGTSHYFYQAGANIPLAWYFDMIGDDYSRVCTTVTENKWFIDEVSDIENVYCGRISRKQWEKERSEATVFKYYDESDMMPYKNQGVGKLFIFKNLLINRYRPYILWVFNKLGIKQ